MKHLLKMSDLSPAELHHILDVAEELKAEQKAGTTPALLKGRSVALMFSKNSTRTRTSFEVGVYQLGGLGNYMNAATELQSGRGEPLKDTARVLGRYYDCVVWRTYRQCDLEEFAELAGVPVINGLTDYAHPCQVLADLMTIRERRGTLEGQKLCFIGDGCSMANSLIVGGLLAGMRVTCVCPEGYRPAADVLMFAHKYGEKFHLLTDPAEGVKDADVVVTAAWNTAPGTPESERRLRDFAGFQVTSRLMEGAKPDAMLLHCLPAHRGEEISTAVFEEHADEIFDEAENRLHVQKAVLAILRGSYCFSQGLQLRPGPSSDTRVGGEAAVNGQADAGDEAGSLVVQQEQQGTHQILFAVAEAAHGGGSQDLFGAGGGGAVLVVEEPCVLLAGKEARGNGVDPDAHLAEVHCQPLGEVGDGSLGAGVGRDLGQGQVGVHAGDVHDVAAGAAHHLPGKGLRGQQGADEVQVEHHLHAALVQIEEGHGVIVQIRHLEEFLVGVGPGVVAAGTVHQNVAGTQIRHHLLCHLQAVGLVHNVAGVALGNAAFCLDRIGQLLQLLHVAAQQSHFGSCPGQSLGENGTKGAAGTGDHGNLAGQVGVQNILFHEDTPFLIRWLW